MEDIKSISSNIIFNLHHHFFHLMCSEKLPRLMIKGDTIITDFILNHYFAFPPTIL
jgi:hypothetical protein